VTERVDARASTREGPTQIGVPAVQAAKVSRLVVKSDFEALLGSPARKRSAHFVIHHLEGWAATSAKPQRQAKAEKLSTDGTQLVQTPVDDLSTAGLEAGPQVRLWLGCVVPKRHAKRAVTRNLLKRQMRQAFQSQADSLPPGRWLMRMNRGFAITQFRSAASEALRLAAAQELHKLLLGLSSGSAACRP
jgi:ribonuclease P protein component